MGHFEEESGGEEGSNWSQATSWPETSPSDISLGNPPPRLPLCGFVVDSWEITEMPPIAMQRVKCLLILDLIQSA